MELAGSGQFSQTLFGIPLTLNVRPVKKSCRQVKKMIQFDNWKNVWKIREILFQLIRTRMTAMTRSR